MLPKEGIVLRLLSSFWRNVPVFFRKRAGYLFLIVPQKQIPTLPDRCIYDGEYREQHKGSYLFLFFSSEANLLEISSRCSSGTSSPNGDIIPREAYHTRRVPPWGAPGDIVPVLFREGSQQPCSLFFTRGFFLRAPSCSSW
jgi:hypothetical protein